MKHRFFKIGYILLALAITGMASVETWHRVENTQNKRTMRVFKRPQEIQFGDDAPAPSFAEFAESLNLISNGGLTEDVRGDYLKYPLGVLALSAFCFLGGYLVGDGSDEKKRQSNSVG